MRTAHQPRRRHQHLWLAVSNSEGESWSRPEATNIRGYPANLLLLRDCRMLATYSYRRSPWGMRAQYVVGYHFELAVRYRGAATRAFRCVGGVGG